MSFLSSSIVRHTSPSWLSALQSCFHLIPLRQKRTAKSRDRLYLRLNSVAKIIPTLFAFMFETLHHFLKQPWTVFIAHFAKDSKPLIFRSSKAACACRIMFYCSFWISGVTLVLSIYSRTVSFSSCLFVRNCMKISDIRRSFDCFCMVLTAKAVARMCCLYAKPFLNLLNAKNSL